MNGTPDEVGLDTQLSSPPLFGPAYFAHSGDVTALADQLFTGWQARISHLDTNGGDAIAEVVQALQELEDRAVVIPRPRTRSVPVPVPPRSVKRPADPAPTPVGDSELATAAGHRHDEHQPRRSARRTVTLAARIAGERFAVDAEAWLGDLRSLTGRRQMLYALGLLHAGLRMRARDAVRWAGRRLDWWLETDTRVAWVCFLAFLITAGRIGVDGGLLALVQNGPNIFLWTAGPWGAARVLRRIRGIRVCSRKTSLADRARRTRH